MMVQLAANLLENSSIHLEFTSCHQLITQPKYREKWPFYAQNGVILLCMTILDKIDGQDSRRQIHELHGLHVILSHNI